MRRCFAAAGADRISAYQQRHGGSPAAMAVLVQVMVDTVAAGVAFTAHPVTGDRDQIVVTAVAGLGDRLVSGEAVGEEWTITRHAATLTRPVRKDLRVLTAGQAQAVADLARRVAERYGRAQDIEWAIDRAGMLWLLQARPMTAVPDTVSWTAPGPGLWMRNFRLGEWLPEAVTPLFATWLLPVLEGGYLDGMHATVGVRVPFPICAGQRLVLQHPSDPVTKAVGASAVARTRSRGEGLVQRADPSQPQPCRRRPGSAVGSGPAVARGSTARVPAASRSTPKPRPRRRHRTSWRS